VLLFALPPLAAREREGRAHILAVVALIVVGVGMQGRFFVYHYGGALPLVALLAGWGLWKVVRAGRRFAWGALVVAGLVLLLANANHRGSAVPGDFFTRARKLDDGSARNAPLRKVAAWVRGHTRDDDRIYVWGFEPLLYDLAGRRPASRFIYNAPQRAPWSRQPARDELMHELQASPPAVILVEHGDLHPGTAATEVDSATTLAGFTRLRALLDERYVPSGRIDRFTVHLRKDGEAPRP
jgi:hypothetical protein